MSDEQVLRELRETTDKRVRNRLALRVIDEDIEGGAEALIELIAKDELKDQRGTLLYVLMEMGAGPKVPVAVLEHIADTGGFEEAHHAMDILDDLVARGLIPPE